MQFLNNDTHGDQISARRLEYYILKKLCPETKILRHSPCIVLHFDALCLVQGGLPGSLFLQLLDALRLADGRQRPRRLLLRLEAGERALRVQSRLLLLFVRPVRRGEVELGEDHLALLVEHLALLRVALAALALLVLGHLLEVELASLEWTKV